MQLDGFTIVAQVVNFLILVALLKRFLYAPIIGAMQAREDHIAMRLDEAQEKISEAQRLAAVYDQRMQTLQQTQDAMLTQAQEEAASGGRIGRHLHEISVGIAEIQRLDRSKRSRARRRPLLDRHTLRFEMRGDLMQRGCRDEAEVAGTRHRPRRLGFVFTAGGMEVDLVGSEMQRLAFERPELVHGHAEDAGIELARLFDVAHRQHEMIDPLDLRR